MKKKSYIKPLSKRTEPFQESVIREMTRLGEKIGGVDLAQGLPDFEPPKKIIQSLKQAVSIGINNQYSFTWGSLNFRKAVCDKYARFNNMKVNPETDVTITCGVSEALNSTILALTEPGDEVIILEPWYENYLPVCFLSGVKPRFVSFNKPDYSLDFDKIKKAINKKTRLILLNTPGNPTGRVLNKKELNEISSICQKYGLLAVVDEIYEHIWYEGHKHISLASLPGMKDRTITLSGLGKSYAVTGWRIGWAVAAKPLSQLIRKVHDYLTVCAPSPMQEAGCIALALPDSYYETMREKYSKRRKILLTALEKSGFEFSNPQGAYYVLVDAAPLGWKNDREVLNFFAHKVGIISVPGSSFYYGNKKNTCVRLNFAKKEETLRKAADRILNNNLRAR